LLSLSACELTRDASQLPVRPANIIERPANESMLERMATATDGAQGLREDWLLDFAAEAEKYRLQLESSIEFMGATWESRQ